MPVFKVQLFFNHSVMGWSETYYTPSLTGSDVLSSVQGLLDKRNALLFSDDYWVGIRGSIVGSTRNSSMILPTQGDFCGVGLLQGVPVSGVLNAQSATMPEGQLRAAVQIRLTFADTRKTMRYLTPCPSNMVGTEPATIADGATTDWKSRLNAFRKYLTVNGYQIRAQVVGADAKTLAVANVVQGIQTPPLLGIVCPSTSAPSFGVGQELKLQGFRPPKGSRLPTINGTWYCDSVNFDNIAKTATVYLRKSDKVTPAQVDFTAASLIRVVDHKYYPIQRYDLFRIGVHKRGRPSTAPRGRRLTRLSLDP